MNVPDNYDAFCWHEAKQERWLEKLPKCSECSEPIQDEECYELNGELYCNKCMNSHSVFTENYYRED